MHEELIEAVRNRTVLYDTNNPEYMRSKLKDEIWNEIAKKVNLKVGADAKNAWLKLRNCHRDALRRQRKCFKSGAAAVVVKPWKFQKQMEFLVPYMANRSRCGNIGDDSDYEESQEQAENTETENVEENVDTENVDTENSEHNEDDNNRDKTEKSVKSPATPSSSSTLTSVPRNKRFKKDDIGSVLKQSIQRHEQRAQDRALERKKLEQLKAPSDHLYHFFMSMYEITKIMPPASQHLVRNNVFQAVSQVEADLLNTTSAEHIPTHFQYQQPRFNQSRNSFNRFTYNNPSTSSNSALNSPYSSISTPLSSPPPCYENDMTSPTPSTSGNLINYINNFSE
ncbi:hypothetical protein NQ314_013109 [Rhamnusium bicolor]|uniref:MADF domain-containing protein n=1 Tax=Rhamnusium bicolor TaxID=1586634 RepID=A0AAV8X7H4_9CUCU|nr:hypothetical protein NQ314_013109 [Rhamnusium bicolor]